MPTGRRSEETATTARRFLLVFVPPLVTILAGAVVLGLTDRGTTAGVVGWALSGLGGVWAVLAAFYEVGRSEDRDRERHRHG
jgi:hypothetical protein